MRTLSAPTIAPSTLAVRSCVCSCQTTLNAQTSLRHARSLACQKAAALHLRSTHFTNPSGLDDADHYSSAYDLAVVGATLLADYPELRTIVGSTSISARRRVARP